MQEIWFQDHKPKGGKCGIIHEWILAILFTYINEVTPTLLHIQLSDTLS